MDLQKILEENGLSEKEARVYLALLSIGEACVATIAKKAEVPRPTTYLVLEKLEQQGLLSSVHRENVLYYRTLNPYSLVQDRTDKLTALEKALPMMSSLHKKASASPRMAVFHGEKGLRQVMDDCLTSSTELLCWANITLAMETLGDYYPYFINERVARGIYTRCILTHDEIAVKMKEEAAEKLREVYLVPAGRFPLSNEVNIYDDKIASLSHHEHVAVIIQNESMANTFRSVFELSFAQAKSFEQNYSFDQTSAAEQSVKKVSGLDC